MDISTISPRRTSPPSVDKTETDLPVGARTRFVELRQRAMESEESAEMKRRLGERMVDLTEEYFAEEVASRRRRIAGAAFAAGVAVGGVGVSALSRR